VAFTFTDRAAAPEGRISTRIRARFGEVTGLADMYVAHPRLLLNSCRAMSQSTSSTSADGSSDTPAGRPQLRQVRDEGLGLKRWVESKLFIDVVNMLREATLIHRRGRASTVDALAKYEALLRDKRFLDYASIMANAVRMVENDQQIRNELAARVKYLVVDVPRCQSASRAANQSTHNLGAQLCVCGDDDQTLYQFRGSEIATSSTSPNAIRASDRSRSMRFPQFVRRRGSGSIVIAANDPDRCSR